MTIEHEAGADLSGGPGSTNITGDPGTPQAPSGGPADRSNAPQDADEFQQMWKAYDAKLEKSLKLNHRLMQEIGTSKVRASFNRLALLKLFMIMFGVGWNIFVGTLLYHFHDEPMFVTAAVLSLLFTSFAICGYTMQLLLILRINMVKNILDTQQELAHLETIFIWTYRILILQAPLYTFFFLTKGMMAQMSVGLWILQGSLTGLFIAASIWLYRNINAQTKDKRWVRSLLNGEGGQSIARARSFIREIEEWRAE